MLPSEEVGIWAIFTTLIAIPSLLDFGFSNSFSRNITYVYSGVKELKVKGYTTPETSDIDYSLLKSLLSAVKRYYGIVALFFLIVYVVISPFYLPNLLKEFSGDIQTIWIAWFVFGGLLAYELYTYCYNALLLGRGMVKRSMQITVFTQTIRIILTVLLLLCGLRIISLVLGILVSDIVNRVLLHLSFYDKETKKQLSLVKPTSVWRIIKTLVPNSLKTGLILLGAFMRTHFIIFIAPYYLSLSEMAELDIPRKVISLIVGIGSAWFFTFYAKISQYHVQGDLTGVKRLYIKGKIALIVVFVVAGSGFLLFGSDILNLIKSQTPLLCNGYLFIMLLFSFFETNQVMANHIFITKNEVPFYNANLISGFLTIVALMLMLHFTSFGILSFILASGLVMCAYMNWKVPLIAAKELKLSIRDYFLTISMFYKESFSHK